MRRHAPLLTWAVLLALPPAAVLLPPLTRCAVAQDDALEELYGNGVHLYNAGDFRASYYELTRAVDNGSQDPRVFYYRGLCYLKLGREQQGMSDFSKAAGLEMSDNDRFYPVSKSLERVQGRARQLIERYRSSARLRAFQTRERARFERYERIRRNEPNVLLTPAPGESSKLPIPAGDEPPKPEADDAPQPEMDTDEAPPEPEADDAFAPEAEKPEAEMPAEEPDAETPAEEPDADMPAEKPEADAPAAADAATTTKVPASKLGKSVGGALLRALAKPRTPAGAAPAAPAPPVKPPAAPPPADDDPFKQ